MDFTVTAQRYLLLGLLLLWLCGCKQPDLCAGSANPASPGYRVPEQTDDGWRTASLVEQGIESAPIRALIKALRSGAYEGVSSVLLVRRGFLVLEEYCGQSSRERLHSTRSASKAITSALVGIAVDQGYIESVDEPLLPFFP